MSTWKYYNKALIPNCAPHEEPDIEELKDKKIWNQNGKKALFARWTTDWDCGYETDWWYVIKDEPFDISKLKAKRRYEINKGLKNFEIKRIKPNEYKDELFKVEVEAYSAYPKKYRPNITYDSFTKKISNWNKYIIFGAFQQDILCGFALLSDKNSYIYFSMLKTIPKFEKEGINAALVYSVIMNFNNELNKKRYICDGQRAVLHETQFQNYLEKYFEFKKVYCKLHIKYNSFLTSIIVKIIYPFKRIFKNIDNKVISNLKSVLIMEEISRKCSKGDA